MKTTKNLNHYFYLGLCVIFFGCGGRNGNKEGVKTEDSLVSANLNKISTNVDSTLNNTEKYKAVTISNQTWMVENLNVSVYRNGDTIPEAKSDAEWTNAGKSKQGAWCYYENKAENGEFTGKLYNFYAVSDPRGLAPEGWMIPRSDDFEEMANSFGVDKKAGANFRSTSGWNQDGNGTNGSGFDGRPGGIRSFVGAFSNKGDFGYWWSSSERPNENAWHFSLSSKNPKAKSYFSQRANGLSVRCIKEK